MKRTNDETVDGVMDALEIAGLEIVDTSLIPTGMGARIDLSNGAIVNIYITGTVQVQGKNIEEVRRVLREFVNARPGEGLSLTSD